MFTARYGLNFSIFFGLIIVVNELTLRGNWRGYTLLVLSSRNALLLQNPNVNLIYSKD